MSLRFGTGCRRKRHVTYVGGARSTERLVENVLGGRLPNDYALALIGPNETLTTVQQKDQRLITLAKYHNEENVMRIVDLKREKDTMNTHRSMELSACHHQMIDLEMAFTGPSSQ